MQKGIQESGSLAAGESVTEGAARIANEARAVAGDTARFAKSKAEALRGLAEEKTDEALAWVRARPLASVMIALGVGYLLGRMMRR
jgi:ElaB/YqjD/DUF883 family membrane-anchored ribosome-binding protein